MFAQSPVNVKDGPGSSCIGAQEKIPKPIAPVRGPTFTGSTSWRHAAQYLATITLQGQQVGNQFSVVLASTCIWEKGYEKEMLFPV